MAKNSVVPVVSDRRPVGNYHVVYWCNHGAVDDSGGDGDDTGIGGGVDGSCSEGCFGVGSGGDDDVDDV